MRTAPGLLVTATAIDEVKRLMLGKEEVKRTPLTPYVELGFKVEDVVEKKAEELRQKDLQEDAALKERLAKAQASREQEVRKKEQALAAEMEEVQSAESDLVCWWTKSRTRL